MAQAATTPSLRTVETKPMTARFSTSQWAFHLIGPRRQLILRETAGTGTGPVGRLGFMVDGSWQRATRVVDSWRRGNAWLANVETTDPSRSLRVVAAPAGYGSIRLRAGILGSTDGVSRFGMSFGATKSEHYLGFGERSNAVDFKGQDVENWVGEGPYQPVEYAAVGTTVPHWALRERPDATYFPMPWLLSTDGYGVLVENSEPSYFRLGTDSDKAWSVELSRDVDGLANQPADRPSPGMISLRFFAGPRPADVLKRMSAAIGRQPASAPWFFGPWVQSKGGDQNTIDNLKAADSPTSVGQTYTHYLPCGPGNRSTEVSRTNRFHGAGMAITTYFNPMICTNYNPRFNSFNASGQITRNRDGDAYEYDYLSYHVGQFDFSNPAAGDSYGGLLHEALDDGYDGWMEDFGEYTPPDSVSHDGTPGMVEHNRYPTQYHCAAHEQTKDYGDGKPLMRFVRSGFTGTAPCAPIVWGGDPSTEWDYDGLRASIRNGISMGLSGVGIWGSDIGGFFSMSSPELSPELLARWVQFGAFSGVMRNQADGLDFFGHSRPQILDPDQIDNWRRYAKIRTQLYPYISASADEYRRTGMPMMRALALQYPKDSKALGIDDQYMFGPNLMVAPVTEPGQTTEPVYLPHGLWVDFWRSVSFDQTTGSLSLGGTRTVKGSGTRTLAAPSDQIPVLARAGALLPLLPSDVDTLAPYGQDDPSIVHLADRGNVRRLLAFPRGKSGARFDTRGWIQSADWSANSGRFRQWNLTVMDRASRTWEVEASTATLQRPFAPRCVKLNGRALPRASWRYTASGRLLKVTVQSTGRRDRLTVSPSACRR
jgi:alpha-glucosidase (family GH31 glycosyl hydrolase)